MNITNYVFSLLLEPYIVKHGGAIAIAKNSISANVMEYVVTEDDSCYYVTSRAGLALMKEQNRRQKNKSTRKRKSD